MKSQLPCYVNNGVINAHQGMPCVVTVVENNPTSFCALVGSTVLGYINFEDSKPSFTVAAVTDMFDIEQSLEFIATRIKLK